MQEKTTEEIKNTEWSKWLLEELKRQTERRDIDVRVSSYSSHDVMLAAGADGQPIVSFSSDMREDSQRVTRALDYTKGMLENWEVTLIMLEKAKENCAPIHERIQREFPHIESSYTVLDSGKHCVRLAKTDDKIVSNFDLWPQMTDDDVKRLISHIRDLESVLHTEEATYAEMSYFWK